MIDPLYAKIIAGLEGLSDGDKFEACANSLLRDKYPHLTWIKGGNDAGFDGTQVDAKGKRAQLVTTTQDDVIGNVTNSLNRAKEENRPSDIVIVATSRALSPERKRNIEDRIREFGKEPYPIEDQSPLAELIYHSPRWRVELLGIPGRPPALTLFPVSDRTYLPIPPIGRDPELAALAAADGDLVIYGQPGSGKTHLLAHVAKTTGGLFLASTDPTAIMDGIREQRPKWIIVDDAFSRRELLRQLRGIRHDTGATFRLVAACWPGQQDEVSAALDTVAKPALEIMPLPQSNIKEIINVAGIGGPNGLLKELIHQADGKPGLAVTLARLCLQQNVRDVVAGRALARDVKRTLDQLAGKDAVSLLGFFALSGDAGLDLETAAKVAGLALATAQRSVESMGAAGVLQVVAENRLAVEPARLRQALVAETFCQPGFGLDWQPLLEAMPDRSEALTTVICGSLLGGKLDDTKVQAQIAYLAEHNLAINKPCECYVRLGYQQSIWVLQRFPGLLDQLADPLLENAPRESLPLLIRSDHKLRVGVVQTRDRLKPIQKWIDGVSQRPETVKRRKLFLDALVELAVELKGSTTLLSGLAHVFSLRFEWVGSPAGQAAAITFTNGSVPEAFVPEIAALWGRAMPLLKELPAKQLPLLNEIIADWAFPNGRLSGKMSPEHAETCRKFGATMLRELLAAYAGRTLHALHSLRSNRSIRLAFWLQSQPA